MAPTIIASSPTARMAGDRRPPRGMLDHGDEQRCLRFVRIGFNHVSLQTGWRGRIRLIALPGGGQRQTAELINCSALSIIVAR